MPKNKVIIICGIIAIIVTVGVTFIFVDKGETQQKEEIRYYTCGMHPGVKVSPEEYKKGKTNCPICNMKLVPVHKEHEAAGWAEESYYGCGMEGTEHVFLIKGDEARDMTCPICGMPLKKLSKEEADRLKGVVSRVRIKGEQIKLAGVRTEPVRRLHLYKEIRTVGKVAYDPELAITEEEFISALKATDKMKEGMSDEIKERALGLVESSRRKLRLLGLSGDQIAKLTKTRKVHTSYILPEGRMWIYGDIYEYELSWVKPGGEAKVTAASLPGEEFEGVISSVNPVLDPKTRSVTFRVEVDNPGLKLQPEMYVDIVIMSMYISPANEQMVLAIPKETVLDTGTRRIVWVDAGDGEYEGRVVGIGPEAVSDIGRQPVRFYPVLSGLKEGERVVTKANFLIDSQSQLTGVAATAYGGALGAEEEKAPRVHQH